MGSRPTVDGTGVRLEVHIFEFDEQIYGRHIRVEFVERLRDEQRFESVETMIEQLHRVLRFLYQVVEAHADYRQGIRHQFGGAQSFVDITRHVAHFTVVVARDPVRVIRVLRVQVGVGDADLLKAQFCGPFPDLDRQVGQFLFG